MPLVPRLIVISPSLRAPVPIALIILSPPPDTTAVPSLIPSIADTSLFTSPIIEGDWRIGGSLERRVGEIRETRSSHYSPVLISIRAVPEASPLSIITFPVRK